MKTNLEFVEYLKNIEKKNTVYMWGDYGRLVTNNTINGKVAQYPDEYSNDLVLYLKSLIDKNYYAFDCAGLIKSYWMSNFGTEEVKYNSEYDLDARGITIGNAKKQGNIADIPNIPGLLLYMNGHCGVYLGDGKVIECTSNERISHVKYGKVCYSNLSDRNWLYYTESNWLNYVTSNAQEQIHQSSYTILPGDTLTSIASKFNTTVDDIVSLNNIPNKDLIYAGDTINLPNKTYIVQSGDTLSSIAQKFNMSWQDLYSKNMDIIKDPNLIYPNQILKL